jgi:uncharacterized protein YdcH (DUF465 family)
MDGAQLPQEHVKAALLQHDAAFRDLVHEHHILDEQIRQLTSFPYPTDQQQLEEAALKKRKLALKDRVEAKLRDFGAIAGTA